MSEDDLLLREGIKKSTSFVEALESFGRKVTGTHESFPLKDKCTVPDVDEMIDAEDHEQYPPGFGQYDDFHTIDWQRDLARDRLRHKFVLKKSRESICNLISGIFDAGSGWICVLLVGIAAGCDAGIIDISTNWMTDLKEGVCPDAFWFDREHCCWSANDTLFAGDKCSAVREFLAF
ncbi:unnamed protein product [Soboliphyme baturini]|uniref:H(+)/Cl(-) exchange transporter 4 n=1 Tax=Soboliphyme baturini TaxID=241478 RepID=A0A183IIY6_9BILA|nr:unnamed protein product [Soboliphyme baturini]